MKLEILIETGNVCRFPTYVEKGVDISDPSLTSLNCTSTLSEFMGWLPLWTGLWSLIFSILLIMSMYKLFIALRFVQNRKRIKENRSLLLLVYVNLGNMIICILNIVDSFDIRGGSGRYTYFFNLIITRLIGVVILIMAMLTSDFFARTASTLNDTGLYFIEKIILVFGFMITQFFSCFLQLIPEFYRPVDVFVQSTRIVFILYLWIRAAINVFKIHKFLKASKNLYQATSNVNLDATIRTINLKFAFLSVSYVAALIAVAYRLIGSIQELSLGNEEVIDSPESLHSMSKLTSPFISAAVCMALLYFLSVNHLSGKVPQSSNNKTTGKDKSDRIMKTPQIGAGGGEDSAGNVQRDSSLIPSQLKASSSITPAMRLGL